MYIRNMRGSVFGCLILMSSSAGWAESTSPEQLLVMNLNHSEDVKPDVALTLTDLVTAAFSEIKTKGEEQTDSKAYRTLSGEDIRKMLEIEGDKQTLGCEGGESCLEEIAGAMGSRFVVYGRISSLGELLVLQLNVFDAQAALPISRKVLKAKSLGEFADSITPAAEELSEAIFSVLDKERDQNAATSKPGGAAQTSQAPNESGGLGPQSKVENDSKTAPTTSETITQDVEPVTNVPEEVGFSVGPWSLIAAGGLGLVVGVLAGIVGALPYWMATNAATKATTIAGQQDERLAGAPPAEDLSAEERDDFQEEYAERAEDHEEATGQYQVWTAVYAAVWIGAATIATASFGALGGGAGWLLLSGSEEE
jgi:hypothetical protein